MKPNLNKLPFPMQTMSHITWSFLARQLNVSPRALRDWRKLPDAPAAADFDKWATFIEMTGLGTAGNRVSANREELLIANLAKKSMSPAGCPDLGH
jgi:hypothetical protein